MQKTECRIPYLYETEEIPFERKTIYQRWQIKKVNFNWLIAELDEKEGIAFGFANLNDDELAEWGYIDMKEIQEAGAQVDGTWRPCIFSEAVKKIKEEAS